MRLYGIHDDCPLCGRRPAVTMGVFDGVHLGHRAIIEALVGAARRIGSPAMAITFNPHPRQALGRSAPPGICSMETRLKLLAEAGLDAVWVLPFTAEFSRVSGQDFAEEYFYRRLDAGVVALGESAVFGRDRGGNAATLARWAANWNMEVIAVPQKIVDGAVVSSTAIRLAVQNGELERAARFLGRPFAVEGTVVHGQGHGRNLGFPTLNLDPHHELRPPAGVYLTLAVVDGAAYPSITNIGRPPTEAEIEAGLSDFLIETHLLDYQGDLYGRTAEVRFLSKTRDVLCFPRMSGLVRQVEKDLRAAREWFVTNGTSELTMNNDGKFLHLSFARFRSL